MVLLIWIARSVFNIEWWMFKDIKIYLETGSMQFRLIQFYIYGAKSQRQSLQSTLKTTILYRRSSFLHDIPQVWHHEAIPIEPFLKEHIINSKLIFYPKFLMFPISSWIWIFEILIFMYGSQSIAGCRANIKCKKKRLFSEQYLLLRVIVEHFFIYLFCFLVFCL